MRPLFLAAALILAALPAAARPLDQDEADKLGRAVESYMRATKAGDAAKIVAAIPPRILNIFAGSAGIEAKNLTKTLETQTRELTKGIKISDTAASIEAADAQDTALADGTRVTWVVVPTAFTVEQNGQKSRNEQALLALDEGGKWYFVRVDGAQQRQIAGIAYPFLADAPIPEPRVTPLQ